MTETQLALLEKARNGYDEKLLSSDEVVLAKSMIRLWLLRWGWNIRKRRMEYYPTEKGRDILRRLRGGTDRAEILSSF